MRKPLETIWTMIKVLVIIRRIVMVHIFDGWCAGLMQNGCVAFVFNYLPNYR